MNDPLKRLSAIQAQILSLKGEAFAILDSLRAGFDSPPRTPTPAAVAAVSMPAAPRGKKAAPKPRGSRKRSPSGPLAPAVVALLKAAGKPLKVAEIYEGLLAANYVFTSGNAKKNLGIRLYTLPPVKSLGGGLFGLDERSPTA